MKDYFSLRKDTDTFRTIWYDSGLFGIVSMHDEICFSTVQEVENVANDLLFLVQKYKELKEWCDQPDDIRMDGEEVKV